MSWKADIVVGIVLISTFILLIPAVKPLVVPIDVTFVPEKIVFDFTRTITLSGNFVRAHLQVAIPQNTSSQNIYVKQIEGSRHTTQKTFTTFWDWNINHRDSIKIEYSGVSYGRVWEQESSSTLNDIPQKYKEKYLHSEYIRTQDSTKYVIFVDNEEIRTLALKITSQYSTILDKLKAIHTYIARNYHYEASTRDYIKSAVEVLHSGSGDCDELSFLYVSLARSIGIPAWVVYGLLYDGTTWGYHAWVRTYIPDIGEVDCDVVSDLGQIKFVGFLTKTPYHIEIWADDGNSEHLSEMYTYVDYVGILQISDSYATKTLKQSAKNVAISNPYIIRREYVLAIIGILFLVMYLFSRKAPLFMVPIRGEGTKER